LGGILEHGNREERNKELTIPQLTSRIKNQQITEVILALNPTTEGDYTILTLVRELAPLNTKVTQLARGLATGSDIEHADDRTMRAALTNRELIS
jgi:recombination protein RecR